MGKAGAKKEGCRQPDWVTQPRNPIQSNPPTSRRLNLPIINDHRHHYHHRPHHHLHRDHHHCCRHRGCHRRYRLNRIFHNIVPN
ncbi:hypothetical protein BU24DRAFT_154263 [Aaosphaeria arxii CBS 175.79]|uniref:Uncharacterized protein n=1 Tax=Aaosphaeria arxii CBS 175.79 TaxID=1450172 RepID=A0A6A5XXD8_9PLEO|nr:uncharacterized protein BU24DRAFT_154263 [Aaosphaeria arxii CBS 175.79]KAF2017616.1 hypothetical protein BU24DRAFT_154263 [Aaosphaeria arxii CBS 175.79]